MVAVDCTALPVLTSVFGSLYTSRVNILCKRSKSKLGKCADWNFHGGHSKETRAHTMEHLPFSAHGLFFLSGVWIRGS